MCLHTRYNCRNNHRHAILSHVPEESCWRTLWRQGQVGSYVRVKYVIWAVSMQIVYINSISFVAVYIFCRKWTWKIYKYAQSACMKYECKFIGKFNY